MIPNQVKYNQQIVIDDLFDDAVANALARRIQGGNAEDTVLHLSDEEAAKIAGGYLKKPLPIPREPFPKVITVKDPLIVGLIAVDPVESKLLNS